MKSELRRLRLKLQEKKSSRSLKTRRKDVEPKMNTLRTSETNSTSKNSKNRLDSRKKMNKTKERGSSRNS
jgi:hypothetical protein